MAVDELREAINLIKVGRMVEARAILEPYIIANPHNIQAWGWEVETRQNVSEKIKLMEACLLHNPDAAVIKKALAALKAKQETPVQTAESNSPFILDNKEPLHFSEAEDVPIEDEEPATLIVCPNCGELIKEDSIVCESCGHKLSTASDERSVSEESISPLAEEEKPAKKKWYRRSWVKILTFVLCMPLWCVIELSDHESHKGTKILAGVLLAFIVNALCFFFYWLITTNTSRANLLNWYQYLTDQTAVTVPGGLVRVDGNVQNPGGSDFSMIELQAKVYDKDGNLLGNSTRYIDSSSILPGAPTRFQMDVTSLANSVNGGLANLQVLYYDDFSNTASGWPDSASEEGEITYFQGQYRIKVETPNYDLWSNPGATFNDVKVEVDATKLAGSDSNRFGIQCRYVNKDNYYFAVISSDGYYGIGKVLEGSQSFLRESGMLPTDKIFAGSTMNHIRFDCVGSRLTLYVNGDFVDSVDNDDISAGDVGLIAGTFEKKGTQISFDNFVVTAP